MLLTFESSITKICEESGEIGFELLGFDFMIDEELNTWLIEVNQNPCLDALTTKQESFISKLVQDTMRYTKITLDWQSTHCLA